MANNLPRRAAVLGGNRIPFARQFGAYAEASNQDMFTAALDGLVARYNLGGKHIDEVAGGAVIKHSRDFNLVREAVLGSALAPTSSAYDLQQACGTGLETAILVSNKIKLGQIESGIAGGVDTASDAPITVTESLRKKLLKVNRAKGGKAQALALTKIRPTDFGISTPANVEPRTGLSMGDHMAITAKKWGITREAQDALAAASHKNLAAAYDRGFFDDLVTPFLGLTRDDNLRPGSTVEKLSTLNPVFGVKLGDATMTAGNSTPLTDGASAALLSSDEWAAERNLPVLAHFVDAEGQPRRDNILKVVGGVVGVVVLVNQLEGNLLQPVLMGRSMKLHAFVVLVALVSSSPGTPWIAVSIGVDTSLFTTSGDAPG